MSSFPLPLSAQLHPWMDEGGRGLRPDGEVMRLVRGVLLREQEIDTLGSFLALSDSRAPIAQLAKDWLHSSGSVRESEARGGRLTGAFVDSINNATIVRDFTRALGFLPPLEDDDAAMERDQDLHLLAEAMSRAAVTEMKRIIGRLEQGEPAPETARATQPEGDLADGSTAQERTASRPQPGPQMRAVPARGAPPPQSREGEVRRPVPQNSTARVPSFKDNSARPPLEAAPSMRKMRGFDIVGCNFDDGRELPPPVADRMALLSLLPPPPEKGSHQQNMDWVLGRPWSAMSLGITFGSGPLAAPISADEAMDLETEVHSNFENFSGRCHFTHPIPAGGHEPSVALLTAAATELGSDLSREHGPRALRTAFDRVLAVLAPENLRVLFASDARLEIPEALAQMSTAAYDLAESLVGSGFGEGDQIFLGTITETARVEATDIFQRAVFMHLVAGIPLSQGLVEGIIEISAAESRFERDPAYWLTLDQSEDLLMKRFAIEKEKINTVEISDAEPDAWDEPEF